MTTKMKKIALTKKELFRKTETLFIEMQKKAYCLWEKEGKPHGKDWDIWLKAEKEALGK